MDAAEAFAVLDLKAGASAAEIEAAYKAAVKAWHPDRFNHSPDMRDVAEAKLRRLNEAYEVFTQAVPEGGQPSAPDNEAEYIDEQIAYVGHDPRLPPISGPYAKGRPGIVSVCPRGVALLVGDDPNDPAPMHYPHESLLCLLHLGKTWLTDGVERFVYDAAYRKPELCLLLVKDPNGIEKYLVVELGFRNEYHAKLFVKQAVELLGLQVPKPPASPVPGPPEANEGEAKWLLIFLVVLFLVFPLLVVIVASTSK